MGRSPCSKQQGLNRGAWTADENKLLADYIKAHGEGKWSSISKHTGLKRCGKSCRLRWLNYLRPDIKRGNITDDEEELIIRLHKLLGNRWSLIAGRLPGRTDNEIKNYWNTNLVKKEKGRQLKRSKTDHTTTSITIAPEDESPVPGFIFAQDHSQSTEVMITSRTEDHKRIIMDHQDDHDVQMPVVLNGTDGTNWVQQNVGSEPESSGGSSSFTWSGSEENSSDQFTIDLDVADINCLTEFLNSDFTKISDFEMFKTTDGDTTGCRSSDVTAGSSQAFSIPVEMIENWNTTADCAPINNSGSEYFGCLASFPSGAEEWIN